MKKVFTLLSILIVVYAAVSLTSCDWFKAKDDLKDVQVNPKFEMTPPIAEDVFVQRIEGDDKNVLIIAKFSKEQLGEKFLAINHDNEKIVLRDDGKGVDKVASDGLFTAKVQTDVKEFEKIALTNNKLMQSGKRLTFKGRSVVTDSIRTQFDIERFSIKDFTSIRRLFTIAPPELKDHSLMITDLNVVENPSRTWNVCNLTGNVDGAWTFKTLMKNLASTTPGSLINDVQLSDFVENWLTTWLSSTTINGETVAARVPNMNTIINNWKTRSQTLPMPRVPVGKLDMRAAPFKLLAIVNRLDLRGNSGYGFSNAGEGRFVFCLIENCNPSQFNVIFEYGIPKRNCTDIKNFANQWYDLKNHNFTDPQFCVKLEAITNQFALCGTSPSKPNQSSLNQLRTNEIRLTNPWELREFVIDNASHLLKETTVKQEPAVRYNAKLSNADVQRLAAYINTNEALILANKYNVPDNFSGSTFLGGHSLTQFPPVGTPSGINPHHWNGTTAAGPSFINNSDARQIFSLNTCSGCHGGETQTFFTMINPVPFGTKAGLAGFLTGNATGGSIDLDGNATNEILNVPDPAGRASSNDKRKFSDLQRRADDLEAFVNAPCRSIFHIRDMLMRDPLRFTH